MRTLRIYIAIKDENPYSIAGGNPREQEINAQTEVVMHHGVKAQEVIDAMHRYADQFDEQKATIDDHGMMSAPGTSR